MTDHDLDWLAAQAPQRIALDPAARERALLALVSYSAHGGSAHTPARRRLGLTRLLRKPGYAVSLGAGVTAIAAAIVLSLGVGSHAVSSHPVPGAQAAVHSGAQSPLVHLASYISNDTTLVGDATLVVRTTSEAGQPSFTGYDLYSDAGPYYFAEKESGLQGQVSADDNQAGELFANEVGAAKLAASGADVQTAAREMANAPAIKTQYTPASPEYANRVWEFSQAALIAGAGQPEVRAGVLDILATLPGMSVTHGTFDQQPTLVLTAGTAEMGAGYQEQLTINAQTGVPIRFTGGKPGATPATTVDYSVSRVSLGNLPAAAGGHG